MPHTELNRQCVNTLRILAMDAVQKANSGHPGMPMGMADVAYVLWTRHLKHNPRHPQWLNRDRFILSAGHGSMLLYSLLYLTGYPFYLEDLQRFRQWDSKTPGHPEYDLELGIETTTGPLGQGFGNGVGMALAAKHLAARFNRPDYPIIDHFIYAIVSDGDMMEGLSHEAASLAGHLGLDNLIYLYDANNITIEGSTNLAFTEDVAARFRAYHWHVQTIDGHDHDAIDAALRQAQRAERQPHLIICQTHIAYGSPNKQDSAAAHGEPLGQDEVRLTREALDWPSQEPFEIPSNVQAHFRLALPKGAQAEAVWQAKMTAYRQAYPEESALLQRMLAGALPADWQQALPTFGAEDGPLATRAASGQTLNALAAVLPELIGGSADLAPSTKTALKAEDSLQRDTLAGRNLHFGVREHAMGALLNGMALYGGLRVYGGTFLVFSDYMRPAMRLAALMKLPVIYVLTHDSIFVGEDGPTHQPVEHLLALRTIPGLTVLRPADANETAAAWRVALEDPNGPVALILNRHRLPILPGTDEKAQEGVARGAYVLSPAPLDHTDLLLIATGSEVALALEAQGLLEQRRISAAVISMPSWKRFDIQPLFYQLTVFPPDIKKRLVIEAGVPLGWEKYIGEQGEVIGVQRFGASAPYTTLQREFGFTPEEIADRAQSLLSVE